MLEFGNAHFLTSANTLAQCPADFGAEVCFVGRSNAGKSSCLNAVTGHTKLARTSKTPGRTQLLNFFAVDDECRLVDLPGYGFAQVPLALKKSWQERLHQYLQKRKSLRGIVWIMDARHPLQPADLRFLDTLADARCPIHAVLTKADKLSRGAAQASLLSVEKQLQPHRRCTVQLFSAPGRTGIDTLRLTLSTWLTHA